MVQLNGHIPGMIHYGVGHIRELYGFAGEIPTANAEEYLGMYKDLKGYG